MVNQPVWNRTLRSLQDLRDHSVTTFQRSRGDLSRLLINLDEPIEAGACNFSYFFFPR